jgi:hypothetical protein
MRCRMVREATSTGGRAASSDRVGTAGAIPSQVPDWRLNASNSPKACSNTCRNKQGVQDGLGDERHRTNPKQVEQAKPHCPPPPPQR